MLRRFARQQDPLSPVVLSSLAVAGCSPAILLRVLPALQLQRRPPPGRATAPSLSLLLGEYMNEQLLLQLAELLHEIACFAALQPSALAGTVTIVGRRVGFHAGCDDSLIAILVVTNGTGVQPFLPCFLCLLGSLLALYQKTDHPLRPRLATLFIGIGEFSNVMSVAQ